MREAKTCAQIHPNNKRRIGVANQSGLLKAPQSISSERYSTVVGSETENRVKIHSSCVTRKVEIGREKIIPFISYISGSYNWL
jgi:hypothetical protein